MPAKSFGSQIQLNKIPVLGLVAEKNVQASRPSSPVNGQFFYNETTNRGEVYENGSWVEMSNTGLELIANKGVANGYASLDSATLVPLAQIPIAPSGTSSATQVVRADDSRLSNSRTPTGTAGGDLSGTFPNPAIAALAVTDAKVAAANKDGAVGTPSMRTLGTGAQQALAGNTRLDQVTAPTAAVSLNNQKITALATPTADTDAATKAYVDAARSGLDVKDSVRAATTGNITLSATQTVDGVALVAGDRVLVKDQTTGSTNGIYVVAAGAWTRATDADSSAEVTSGMFTFVTEGTANGDSGWVLTTNDPITLGTTTLTFSQFSGAGQITAGAGLTKTGSTLDAIGTANRIQVNADSIDISAAYVGQTSITTVGTIATGTWNATTIALNKGGTGATDATTARTNLGAVGKYSADLGALTAGVETTITHNLNTSDVQAMFRRTADGYDEVLSWRVITANSIGVTADVAYAASALRVVVMG